MASYGHSVQGGPAPARPPREYTQQQHEQMRLQYAQHQQHDQFQQETRPQQQQRHLQFRETELSSTSHQPPSRIAKRASNRPASSIYSQPSPVDTSFQAQQLPDQYRTYQSQRQRTPQQQPSHDQQHSQHDSHYSDPRSQYRKDSQPGHPRNADGISPESSPDLRATSLAYSDDLTISPNISPLESEFPLYGMPATQAAAQADSAPDDQPPSASRTNIPMMRRERRQTQDAAARTLRETKSKERLQVMQERSNSSASSKRGYKGGEVRWDPQTGELTSSQKGRPSQVKPAEYARGLVAPGSDATSPVEPVPKEPKTGIASFASRLRRTAPVAGNTGPATSAAPPPMTQSTPPVGSPTSPAGPAAPSSSLPVPVPVPPSIASPPRELPVFVDPAAEAFTSSRPAWQGASGRTALVAPVHDTPHVAPLNIPRKSSKRVGSSSHLPDSTSSASLNTLTPAPRPNNPGMASPPVSPSSPGDETQGRATIRLAAASSSEQLSAQTPQAQTAKQPSTSPIGTDTTSYPSPPPSAEPAHREPPSSQKHHQQSQQTTSQIRRKPTPSHQPLASYDESDPFNYNNRTSPNFGASPRPPAPDATEWSQPTSRFSVTTYSSTLHESVAEMDLNDAPELPPLPDPLRSSPPYQIKRRPTVQAESSPVPQPPSPPRHRPAPITTKPLPGTAAYGNVMDRRRPPRMGHSSPNSINSSNDPIVISLKTPWMSGHRTASQEKADGSDCHSSGGEDNGVAERPEYSQLRNKNLLMGGGASRSGRDSDRASMAGSIHKNLPPAPPETSAKDRVTMLNAQLAGLAQRRVNIGRSIKQMTELMPTDNLLATPDVLHKREMEKRKVEGLRSELAEIQREEYEIGLRLHRAYKRLDKNAVYEPTTLWVRRVTG